jgi:hypothetical protein
VSDTLDPRIAEVQARAEAVRSEFDRVFRSFKTKSALAGANAADLLEFSKKFAILASTAMSSEFQKAINASPATSAALDSTLEWLKKLEDEARILAQKIEAL